VILTPVRTPVANAYAERLVRTIRRECLDRILLHNEPHLRRILVDYLEHYHQERPHHGLAPQPPDPPPDPEPARSSVETGSADSSTSTTAPLPDSNPNTGTFHLDATFGRLGIWEMQPIQRIFRQARASRRQGASSAVARRAPERRAL
jgi:Integrase core domain